MKASAQSDAMSPDQLRREAQAWLRCLRSGKATDQDADAFLRWRARGPEHVAALADAQRCWNALGPAIGQMLERDAVSGSVSVSDSGSVAGGDARATGKRAAPAWGRRAFIGGAAGAIAAAGLATVVYSPLNLWPNVGEWRADYRTRPGEQRQIALTDNVSVDLNTSTAIARQNVDGHTAGIELVAGEAAIDLREPGRAFSVSAGVGRSTAQAGRFEVRHTDTSTCVTCVQGALRVDHPLGTRNLAAGQQLVYRSDALGDAAQADLAEVSAWRKGILVFHLTPLPKVIDEINRYRPGRVVLLNTEFNDRKMSGYFSIRSLNVVLSQIQHTYGLSARKLPGGLVLLS
jgi:transmembrane sensor